MRVAVWGAGTIGSGLVYRLVTESIVSEVHWINRSYDKIQAKVIDIEHGLAFAPSCHTVRPYSESRAQKVFHETDFLILTQGAPVPSGARREQVYESNRDQFLEKVIPALEGYAGTVLVISNPVDLLARFVALNSGIDQSRVLGLGTLVETARLRASIGSYLSPPRSAREISAYAVGTHDEVFVPVIPDDVCKGASLLPSLHEYVRDEVAGGAARVKAAMETEETQDDPCSTAATRHPIVEAIMEIVRAVATDSRAILTVSTLDEGSGDDLLFLSLPSEIGRDGVRKVHLDLFENEGVEEEIEACRDGLRLVLRNAGELAEEG